MRRRLLERNGNGERDSLISLKLLAGGAGVAAAERHLSEQQLVDLVIGASSRAGELSAEHHLAGCSLCRQDLDNLRGVDRQLELDGGGHRLAAIPRRFEGAQKKRTALVNALETPWFESAQPILTPASPRGGGEAVGAPATIPRWQRVVVPLTAAVCTVLVLKLAVEMSGASALVEDRGTEIAESTAEAASPTGLASEKEAPAFNEPAARPSSGAIEVTPVAAVEVDSPAVASADRFDDNGMSPGVSVAAPRKAEASPVRRYVDTASRVARQRHPGAGRNDDRISPPPRELGV